MLIRNVLEVFCVKWQFAPMTITLAVAKLPLSQAASKSSFGLFGDDSALLLFTTCQLECPFPWSPPLNAKHTIGQILFSSPLHFFCHGSVGKTSPHRSHTMLPVSPISNSGTPLMICFFPSIILYLVRKWPNAQIYAVVDSVIARSRIRACVYLKVTCLCLYRRQGAPGQ